MSLTSQFKSPCTTILKYVSGRSCLRHERTKQMRSSLMALNKKLWFFYFCSCSLWDYFLTTLDGLYFYIQFTQLHSWLKGFMLNITSDTLLHRQWSNYWPASHCLCTPNEFVMMPMIGFTTHYICWICSVGIEILQPCTIYGSWCKQQYGLLLIKCVHTNLPQMGFKPSFCE